MELQRFLQQQKKQFQVITMPFAGLKGALTSGEKGYLLNPAGCQIALQIPLLDKIMEIFPDAVKQGSEAAAKLAMSLAGPQMRKAPAAPVRDKVTKMPDPKSR